MEEQTRVTEHVSAEGARETFSMPRTRAKSCGIGETGPQRQGRATPHHFPARETHPSSHSMPTGRSQEQQWEGSI